MTAPRRWLHGLKQRGIQLGLERIRRVLHDIETPRHVVRVAGTNGKGSVCTYLGGILQQAGCSVGVYTSPELQRVNERIAVDGAAIDDEELDRHTRWLMERDEGLTFFEALTAIALRYFAERGVDHAILEVGMGGRYDATAAVAADVTVVTTVSLDHTEHLGPDIESIAGEIAGVISGGDVVTGCTGPTLPVIKQRAGERDAALHVVTGDTWRETKPRRFTVTTGRRYDLETRLYGTFQGQNIALAVKAAELLGIDTAAIVDGVAAAWLPGRMEHIDDVMLDAAHNPAAMQALRLSLDAIELEPRCIVFGAMEDKDIPGIIDELPSGEVIATAVSTARAASAPAVAEMLRDAGRRCQVAENPVAALRAARELAGGDLVLVTGSLRLVGEIRGVLR